MRRPMNSRPVTAFRIAATPPAPDGGGGWGRRRLLVVLVLVAAAALLLVAGLGYAAYNALTAQPGADPGRPGTVATGVTNPPSGIPDRAAEALGERRDRIAATPMMSVAPTDAQPAPPAARPADPMMIPAAEAPGPAGVLTGFPKTPQGAVGQLAAIEATVLQAMSIPVANDVYDAWALPGGVGAQHWSMTGNVRDFLTAARMGPEKDPNTVVYATPVGAQVKGTDGPDWVLACVLLQVDAVIEQVAKIGYGHCERMQWHDEPAPTSPSGTSQTGGRWMIAPGDPPAVAPSTWPGTDRAIGAGWKRWDHAQPDSAAGAAGRD